MVKLFTLTEKEKDPEEHADATWVEGGNSEKGTNKKEKGQVRNYTEAQFMD